MLSVVLARLVWRYLRRGSRAASPLVAQFTPSQTQNLAVDLIRVSSGSPVRLTKQLSVAFAISQLSQLLLCWSISGTSAHGGKKKGHLAVPCHRRHLSSFTAHTDHLAIHHQFGSADTSAVFARPMSPQFARIKGASMIDGLKLLVGT